jgi:hypothetical protein
MVSRKPAKQGDHGNFLFVADDPDCTFPKTNTCQRGNRLFPLSAFGAPCIGDGSPPELGRAHDPIVAA